MRSSFLQSLLIVALLAGPQAAFAQDAAVEAPAPDENAIPSDRLENVMIQKQLQGISQDMPREEAMQIITERMQRLLEIGRKIEEDYPQASNLWVARQQMFQAAGFLAQRSGDANYKQTQHELAEKMLSPDVPKPMQLEPDLVLTREKMEDMPLEQQREQIHAFIDRYEGTQAEPYAYLFGAELAAQSLDYELLNELRTKLESDFSDVRGVQGFLEQIQFVGRPFEAELTRLDGSKINLPEDLAGKVVVVDFWATWCGPCVGEIPHMKEVYAEYKDKGVEFVGISLDKPDQLDSLKEFVQDKQLSWIQTYSGQEWADPVARKYNIQGIPSMWVVNADGLVVNPSARGNLEQTLDVVLKKQAEEAGDTETTETAEAETAAE